MEVVGRIFTYGPVTWAILRNCYKKKKKTIQQVINLSFYWTPCRITYTKTDRESLKLEQRALKNQIKTKIWTKEAQSFQILVRTFKFNSHAIV